MPTRPGLLDRTVLDALRAGGRDFFRYANMPLIRRVAAIFWIAGAITGLAVFSASPAGARPLAGWVATAAIAVVIVVIVRRLLDPRCHVTGWELLGGSYFAVISLGILDALVQERLYARIMLLPVTIVAVTQPPRRVAVFYLMTFFVSLQPALAGYPGARADDIIGDSLLWLIIAAAGVAWTTSVHAARRQAELDSEAAMEQARVDDLTGLLNRRAFDEALSREVSRARRSRQPLTLAMVDLDDFKSINEAHGHLVGDQVLRSVGAALATVSRRHDLWFRWGGDEFIGLLTDTDLATGTEIVDRVGAHIGQICARPDGRPLQLQVGVAPLDARMSEHDLLAAADAAVLRAKERGPIERSQPFTRRRVEEGAGV